MTVRIAANNSAGQGHSVSVEIYAGAVCNYNYDKVHTIRLLEDLWRCSMYIYRYLEKIYRNI